MEREDDGGADDGHVDTETKPGEKGTLIGAMVSCVRAFIGEEKRVEDGAEEEGVVVGGAVGGLDCKPDRGLWGEVTGQW